MNKNTCKTVRLAKGEMNVYDFGDVRLHAYKTNDFIDDEVFIVEKDGKAVLIESPCFFDNNSELTAYLKDMQVGGYAHCLSRRRRYFPAESTQVCDTKCRGLFEKRRGKSPD